MLQVCINQRTQACNHIRSTLVTGDLSEKKIILFDACKQFDSVQPTSNILLSVL